MANQLLKKLPFLALGFVALASARADNFTWNSGTNGFYNGGPWLNSAGGTVTIPASSGTIAGLTTAATLTTTTRTSLTISGSQSIGGVDITTFNTTTNNTGWNWFGSSTASGPHILHVSNDFVFSTTDASTETLAIRNGAAAATSLQLIIDGNLFLTGSNVTGSGFVTLAFGSRGSQQLNKVTVAGMTTVGSHGQLSVSSPDAEFNGGLSVTNGLVNVYDFLGSGGIAASFIQGSGTIDASAAALATNGTLTINGTNGTTGTFSGVLKDGGVGASLSLVKTAAGTQVLTGSNTYSGNTTVNGGVLRITNGNGLGFGGAMALSSTVGTTIVNSGTLDLSGSGTTNEAITLNGGALINSAASSTSTLNNGLAGIQFSSSGTNYAGTTLTIAGGGGTGATGSLAVTSSSNSSISSITLTNAGSDYTDASTVTLTSTSAGTGFTGTAVLSSLTLNGTNNSIGGSGNLTVASVVGGSGGFTKADTGTLALSGNNAYTGSTTVAAGTLLVNANNALGTNAAGTVVNSGGALELSNVNYSTAEALSISGTGNGSGALFNTGTSTYAGAINAAANALISAGGSGNVLNLTGGIAKNGTVLTIGGGGTVNVSGVGISGSAANSDLVVDASTLNISAASTYNGPTTVQNAGTLQLGADNVLPSTTPTALTLSSTGKLDMNGHSDTVASLAGDSSGKVTNTATSGTSVLTLNSSSGTTTFAGVIEDGSGGAKVALLKSGLGAQILSGANTYTGDTTVTAGSLLISGALSSATNLTMAATENGGATLAIGKAAGAAGFQTQTVASLSTGTNGFESVIKLDLGPGNGNNDKLVVSGVFNLNGEALNLVLTAGALTPGNTYTIMTWGSGGFADLSLLDLAGSSPGIDISEFSISGGNSLVFTATPEPASVVLFGAGALALVVFRRRKIRS